MICPGCGKLMIEQPRRANNPDPEHRFNCQNPDCHVSSVTVKTYPLCKTYTEAYLNCHKVLCERCGRRIYKVKENGLPFCDYCDI